MSGRTIEDAPKLLSLPTPSPSTARAPAADAPLFGELGYNDGLKNWDLLHAYSTRIPLDAARVAPWRPLVNAYSMNLTALTYSRARFSAYVSHADAVETSLYLVEGCAPLRSHVY